MFKLIDTVLMHLTRKIIVVAAFWGISRKNLAIFSAQFGAIGFGLTLLLDKYQIGKGLIAKPYIIALIILFTVVIFWSNTQNVLRCYRDDDVIAAELVRYSRPFTRVLWILIPAFCAQTAFKYPWPVSLIYFLGYVPGPWYYIYILLNQSPQNPQTLKRWIAGLTKRFIFATNPTE